MRYTNELERKVQTLQTEATTLSAQVTMLQVIMEFGLLVGFSLLSNKCNYDSVSYAAVVLPSLCCEHVMKVLLCMDLQLLVCLVLIIQ